MSIGPAWTPAAAVAGISQAERMTHAEAARHASSAQEHKASDAIRDEQAAGIGATDGEEHETSDRDADGRRLWERPLTGGHSAEPEQTAADAESEPSGVKDPSGDLGGELDLSG